MKNIPSGSTHVLASPAGCVVPKTVDNSIPDGMEVGYQELLGECNPYGHDDKVAAGEVSDAEVLRLVNGLRMFIEAFACGSVPSRCVLKLSFASSRRDRFSDVYGPLWVCRP